jgi:hypothetical protein
MPCVSLRKVLIRLFQRTTKSVTDVRISVTEGIALRGVSVFSIVRSINYKIATNNATTQYSIVRPTQPASTTKLLQTSFDWFRITEVYFRIGSRIVTGFYVVCRLGIGPGNRNTTCLDDVCRIRVVCHQRIGSALLVSSFFFRSEVQSDGRVTQGMQVGLVYFTN